MACFERASPALKEILLKLYRAEKPMEIDHHLYEFGSVEYHIQCSPSDPHTYLSISTPLLSQGVMFSYGLSHYTIQMIKGVCSDVVEIVDPAREGYQLTLRLNFAKIPRGKDEKVITELSTLQAVILSSQLKEMLQNVSSQDISQGMYKPIKLVYHPREPFFVIRQPQKITAVFPMRFKENSDVIIATAFFQELMDVGSSEVWAKVPPCTWSPIPPLSVGSAKLARSGLDDLLTSTDGGKHDYDWLLTPPGTPLFPSSDGSESQPASAAPRSSSLVRSSVSATKASRLSVTHSESNHSSRPARSSSVTRSSISSTQYSTYSSNRSSSILNTSSASVSSYTRPSSPITRSPSTVRPSTPSARPTPSRSSTPSKARPNPISTSIDKTRPSNSRPSTPSSRPQIPANLNSPAARSTSRPSTPTRRNPTPSLSPVAGPSTSVGRVLSNGRNLAPSSRPSSPGPRVRTPQKPVVLPDFPHDTPPNLRTTLPDRPVSAGRSRPGVAVTMKGSTEMPGPVNVTRRHSSPIVTRGRLAEPTGRGPVHVNGHVDLPESRKTAHISDSAMRKPVRASTTTTESTGFGRTISKKSLDMAIRHMDIRNGTGSTRPLSGTTLFPQSIRSASSKTQNVRALSAPASVKINGSIPISNNSIVSENGNYINRFPENRAEEENGHFSAKLCEADIYESSRYDAILLKEDLKNTNWLHSVDDKSDQGLIFDNGFEPLPEPFGLL